MGDSAGEFAGAVERVPDRVTVLAATLLLLPVAVLLDVYVRVRYGVWLHRAVNDVLADMEVRDA